jgi:hypothetical protein
MIPLLSKEGPGVVAWRGHLRLTTPYPSSTEEGSYFQGSVVS